MSSPHRIIYDHDYKYDTEIITLILNENNQIKILNKKNKVYVL